MRGRPSVRPCTSDHFPYPIVLMGHGALALSARTVPEPNRGFEPEWGQPLRGTEFMKTMLRSQAFRVVMFLSALASSSLVIAAGQRWK